MKLKSQHPEWCAKTHSRHDFHESTECAISCREREIRGQDSLFVDVCDIGTRADPKPMVRLGPFDGKMELLTHAEARSLGQALMVHAESAEGPEAGRARLLGDVRAHFGQEVAVDVERLLTGQPA